MEAVPTLVGVAGHVEGQEFPLEYGKKVIVGRSRSADWSLVQLPSWTSKNKQEQEDDHAFRTISGKHFEVTMYNLGSIEVVNLSSNGTRLDGKALDRETLTDISANAHEIAFGADEVVKIELRGGDADTGGAAKALDETLEKIDGEEDDRTEEAREEDKPSADEKQEESKEEDKSEANRDKDEEEKED